VSTASIPRHEAVERHLRRRIASLKPDEPLESDAELCNLFQVSRMTVRQATQRLVAEGAIYRISGVGTFVGHAEMHRQSGKLRSFTEEMKLRGHTVASKVLNAEMRQGTADEVARLRLARRSKVVYIRRLRLADAQPMAIEEVALPPMFAWILETDLANGSLHAELSAAGYVPTHASGTQTAALASNEDATLLAMPLPAPVFVERRLITTAEGTPLEATESRYAGSRFVFHVDLTT
jgi:GntR family transcriptional regulator